MDTITRLDARLAAGEVVERFLAGYWCARTRGNYRFILPGGFVGTTGTATMSLPSTPRSWRRGSRR